MRKKYLFIMLLIISAFFFNIKVEAATCPNLTDLKTEASLIEVNYELVKPHAGENGDMDVKLYFYDLYITNLSDNFYIKLGNKWFYSKDAKNGTLYLKEEMEYGGYTARIEIYGTEKSGCKDFKIRSVSFKLPRYNVFSDYPECEGHTGEYPICYRDANTSKYYPSTFREEVAKQAKEYEEKQKESEKEEKKTSKKKNIFAENASLIIAIVVLVLAVAAGVIYKFVAEDKKKAKIDLGVKKNAKKRHK